MDLYDALLARRSCRKYKKKEVSDEQIDKILRAAMAAPSAINKQPWEFYVIKNKELQRKIKDIAPAWDRNSTLLIIVAGNKDKFITGREDFWIEDCGAAVENMLLEATELKLGSLWCGVYPSKERMAALKKLIALPNNQIPFALIHFGYPDEKNDPRTQHDEEKIHYIK